MLLLALLAAILLSLVYAAPTRNMDIRRATNSDFADPAVVKYNNVWYAYATNDHVSNVQMAFSTDFENWRVLKLDALPHVGMWADQKTPQVWAPDVVINDEGKFIMYYSAKLNNLKRHCIGAAIADKPTGPFRPYDGPHFCASRRGGAIDASGFRNVDGQRYVLYKVDGNNIGRGGNCGNSVAPLMSTPLMLQRVGGNGLTLLGDPIQILDRSAADGPLVEAPSLMRTPEGKYVLFFSSNCFATEGYDIAYAMADHISGPYYKAGPLAVTGTSGLYAPGGLSVAPDGEHVVFHAGKVGERLMYTAKIRVDGEKGIVSA